MPKETVPELIDKYLTICTNQDKEENMIDWPSLKPKKNRQWQGIGSHNTTIDNKGYATIPRKLGAEIN
jgi:hypothetical protein